MLLGCGPFAAISSAPQSATVLRSVASVLTNVEQRLGLATLAAAAGERTAASAPSASPPSTSSAQDPSANLPLQFSLRPSVLSPLFATWDQARQAAARRQHLTALLRAQVALSNQIPAEKPGAILGMIRARRDALRKISVMVKQTEREPPLAGLAKCPSPEAAASYCAALEEAARRTDPAAREFAAMQRGETSPWAYYAEHFHERYRNAPRLQPLEVIFSKPDPQALMAQVRAAAALPAGSSSAAAAEQRGGAAAARAGGPHIDLEGITHAAGKRKASGAKLELVPGSGNITVNGLPFASYFRDAAARQAVLEPLNAVGAETEYDVAVSVRGGGLSGQAQAVRTALARALCVQRPGLASKLEEMTRWDGRVVERKKPGREKARRGFTWVKR